MFSGKIFLPCRHHVVRRIAHQHIGQQFLLQDEVVVNHFLHRIHFLLVGLVGFHFRL